MPLSFHSHPLLRVASLQPPLVYSLKILTANTQPLSSIFPWASFFFFLISSSTNWLFRSLLFHFQIFVSFPKFFSSLTFFLFKPLWLGKTLDVILILLNVLRLILWLSIWSVLEIILPAIEKNVFSHFWMECSLLWLFYLLCLKHLPTSLFCYSFYIICSY